MAQQEWSTYKKDNRKNYLVTKKFIGGLLEGIEITTETNVYFPIGFKSKETSGSPYVVTNIIENPR